MGRGRVKLELIKEEKSRLTTFQRRKKGLVKKASEFSILCDSEVCLFVSAPQSDLQVVAESGIETFPPEIDRVLGVIEKYKKAVMQRPPKCKSYHPTAPPLAKPNRNKYCDFNKYPTLSELVDGFSADELSELVSRLDRKIEIVKKVIEGKKKENALDPMIMIRNDGAIHNHIDDQQLHDIVDDGDSVSVKSHVGWKGRAEVMLDHQNMTSNNAQFRGQECMMMLSGAATSATSPNSLAHPMMPYMQYHYPMNVGPSICSFQRGDDLTDVLNSFLYNNTNMY
ncbi:MADS-box transcription factor [Parasponia andersonii]|uniref:MADS-box transcription factor n=1 Tax=Parasponia andersonii TaxID=3476 RepID=A0A2P5DW32_PARAD|nr:MADS-box transcription factor [Parasponia andersonii]